jgi:mannitol-specific phosphotransferase system IIBC component
MFALIGGILLAVLGYVFVSKKHTKTDIETAKKELEEAKNQYDEAKERIEDAKQAVKQAQDITNEEVEHAKEIEVPSSPAAIADALNDVLGRVRGGGESRGTEQQNCDGCAGRN